MYIHIVTLHIISVLVGSAGLTWILPTNDMMPLKVWRSEICNWNYILYTSSFGQYNTTVMNKSDPIPGSSSVFLTETLNLQIYTTALGTVYMCAGRHHRDLVNEHTVSGGR